MLSLNVGDRASITCSVIKGDVPLNVKWLKNGNLIDPSQRISITQVDQYNSILVIEHLLAAHTGNYSCVVSNPAAEAETTQTLLVNGKPIYSMQNKKRLIMIMAECKRVAILYSAILLITRRTASCRIQSTRNFENDYICFSLKNSSLCC